MSVQGFSWQYMVQENRFCSFKNYIKISHKWVLKLTFKLFEDLLYFELETNTNAQPGQELLSSYQVRYVFLSFLTISYHFL